MHREELFMLAQDRQGHDLCCRYARLAFKLTDYTFITGNAFNFTGFGTYYDTRIFRSPWSRIGNKLIENLIEKPMTAVVSESTNLETNCNFSTDLVNMVC